MRGKIAREARRVAGQNPPETVRGFALGVGFIPLPKTYRHRYQALKKRFCRMHRNPVAYTQWWKFKRYVYHYGAELKEQSRQKFGREI